MKFDRTHAIAAVQATSPVAKVYRHGQPLHQRTRAPADEVDLSPVAEALKKGQALLQEKLDKSLQVRFKSVGVDLSEARAVDYSPEAVSDRIAELASAQFSAFKSAHSRLGTEQARVRYQRLFRSGVEHGYAEALKVMRDMALPEDVFALGRETKDLIDDKLDALFASLD